MTVQLVFTLAWALGQTPVGPPSASTGVPACDRYVAMVRACLPKMCEEERALRELELEFALEAIAAVIKHKGAQAAGDNCSADIVAEAGDDLYGCHPESRASTILVEAAPAETSVILRLSGAGLAAAGPLEVALAVPLEPRPAAVYRVTGTNGLYVLDTTGATAATADRVLLERDTPYCYLIATPAESAAGLNTVIRKGTFTTK